MYKEEYDRMCLLNVQGSVGSISCDKDGVQLQQLHNLVTVQNRVQCPGRVL
jgi:hypothetical protein